MATLIVLAGLPGTGKSTLAREMARRLGAVWLRIDSVEQAIARSVADERDLLEDAGYQACYAVAADNLRLGLDVVGDSVNPWPQTRDAWRDAGLGAGARVVEIEVVCSDQAEHRRRVETRASEVPGLVLPDWAAVVGRDYRPWTRPPQVVDTAGRSADAVLAEVLARL
ncbi:MAG: AAA family ATPase [Proteobacteria bacterium]|nr:AAA family ATPase [Pseudomonadota bacterium]